MGVILLYEWYDSPPRERGSFTKLIVNRSGIKEGGRGTRYVCRVGENEKVINLFYENPRWFIERPAH